MNENEIQDASDKKKERTGWRHHALPLLEQRRLKTIAWTEGVGLVPRHQLLHRLQDHAQLSEATQSKSNHENSIVLDRLYLQTIFAHTVHNQLIISGMKLISCMIDCCLNFNQKL